MALTKTTFRKSVREAHEAKEMVKHWTAINEEARSAIVAHMIDTKEQTVTYTDADTTFKVTLSAPKRSAIDDELLRKRLDAKGLAGKVYKRVITYVRDDDALADLLAANKFPAKSVPYTETPTKPYVTITAKEN